MWQQFSGSKKTSITIIVFISVVVFLSIAQQLIKIKQSNTNISQKIATNYKTGTGRELSGNEIMKINIPSLTDNDSLISKYTCDGKNINPEIMISNVPKETKSLLLFVNDPDTPPEYDFSHWILFDINPNTLIIKEGEIPNGAKKGMNDYGNKKYEGPCPPKGQQHRYFFTLYALTAQFSTEERLSKNTLEEKINPYLLQRAEVMGWYKR